MAKKKEPETVMDDSRKNLELVKKAIKKKYGEGVLSCLGDHEDLRIEAVSTGCLSLDSATGVGGFARGRIYEVYGPNSSGKSTLALSVVMQGLLKKLSVVYIDAEHSLDPKLVRNMGKAVGVAVDDIDVVQAYTGDDNLQIAEDLMRSGGVDIIVVDSITALLPQAMADGEIGDNYIGQLARLMSKACNKLTPIVNKTNTLLIFINQIRHDIGKYGDDKVPTGGEAVSFYSTGRIKVVGGESKQSRIVDDDGVAIGHECVFTIIKNKLAAPWRSGKIDLIYGYGYDFIGEVVNLSVDLGLIEQSGAWFDFNGERIQGKNKLVFFFRENEPLYLELRGKVKDMLGLA